MTRDEAMFQALHDLASNKDFTLTATVVSLEWWGSLRINTGSLSSSGPEVDAGPCECLGELLEELVVNLEEVKDD